MTSNLIDAPDTHAAREDLAACFRAAHRHGLHEGICNHFSAMLPGSDTLFLVNPYGWAFEEITPDRLLICDFDGHVVAGSGTPESTAFHIHARLHRAHPRARVALHTHMPYATALCLREGPPLAFASQGSLKFWNRIAVDDTYGGLALDEHEGDRIAAVLGDRDIAFLRHHGVIVTGPTIHEAWDDLYYLERSAELQCLAEATGRPMLPIPADIAQTTAAQIAGENEAAARKHLDSVKRILDRDTATWRG